MVSKSFAAKALIYSISVAKMLQCARQYGRRNGTTPSYITFGEFCILVREMESYPSSRRVGRSAPTKVNSSESFGFPLNLYLNSGPYRMLQ